MPPAGWYQDPARPGLQRWWDGARWTDEVQQMPAAAQIGDFNQTGGLPQQYVPQTLARNPAVDLNKAVKAGKVARLGLIFGAGSYVILYASNLAVIYAIAPWYRQLLEAAAQGRDPRTWPQAPTQSGGYLVGSALSMIGEIGLLAVGILFLMWFYKAATIARDAGLKASLRPGWAIGGFLVPIINLWFPYLVARDLFPRGHPAQRIVMQWWICFILASLSYSVAVVAVFFSVPVAVVMASIAAGWIIASAVKGRQMIAEVGRVHADLVHRY
jgi:hypothetical protein